MNLSIYIQVTTTQSLRDHLMYRYRLKHDWSISTYKLPLHNAFEHYSSNNSTWNYELLNWRVKRTITQNS